MRQVAILMGSKGDLPHCERIRDALARFGIGALLQIASAHKAPERLLGIIRQLEPQVELFITVAGRSNALSGMVDAQTYRPVIACPPYSECFGGVDIFSSLRMPSGVSPLVILEPEEAALAAAKIIGLHDPKVREKVIRYQEEKRREIEEASEELQG